MVGVKRGGVFNAFMTDPDQAARRRELTAFIGPNPNTYLKTYDILRGFQARQAGEKPAARINFSINVLALFLGPCWFFYRKMWLWAVGIVAFEFALGWAIKLPAGVNIGLAVGIAASTRYAYLFYAVDRIVKLRCGDAEADGEVLRATGGVSPLAGWISGGIMLALAGLAIVALIGMDTLHGRGVAR